MVRPKEKSPKKAQRNERRENDRAAREERRRYRGGTDAFMEIRDWQLRILGNYPDVLYLFLLVYPCLFIMRLYSLFGLFSYELGVYLVGYLVAVKFLKENHHLIAKIGLVAMFFVIIQYNFGLTEPTNDESEIAVNFFCNTFSFLFHILMHNLILKIYVYLTDQF